MHIGIWQPPKIHRMKQVCELILKIDDVMLIQLERIRVFIMKVCFCFSNAAAADV